MSRFIRVIGALGLAAASIGACSGQDTTTIVPTSILPLTPAGAGGAAPRSGSAGSATGGSGGSTAGTAAGEAGRSAMASGAETDAGADAGASQPGSNSDPGPDPVAAADAGLIPCTSNADCEDENDCTAEACVGGFCSVAAVAIGTPCGDTTTADECTQPDTCDGNGACLANDEPDGALCADGHCNLAGQCDCAVERITAVPYSEQWQTTADTEIDYLALEPCQLCDGTADHVVVFTAPEDGTYRIIAFSVGGDVELTVFEGDCGAVPSELICGENIDPEGGDLNDRLDLELAAGTTISVVVGEQCEGNGSDGRLSIDRLSAEP